MPAELTLMIFLVYAIAGILAGLIGGMFGLGGGIVLVPILHYFFILQGFPDTTIMQVTVTTSLATITVTAISSTYTHHQKGAVLWPIACRLIPGAIIGAYFGSILADTFSSDSLRIIFGIFEIMVAIQIAFILKPKAQAVLPNTTDLVGSGIGVGLFSTLLGIGGGTLTVPLLLWRNIHLRNAVAISSACSFPIAITGTVAMIGYSLDNLHLPAHSIGYLYWPAALIIMSMTLFFAPLGAHLAHYLPLTTLKRLFAIVLAIIGVKMLLQS